MAGEWLNGLDFQWLRPSQNDGTFMRAMELGMRMKHAQVTNQLAMRESESKVKLMDATARLKQAEITGYERIAEGNAVLAETLSGVGSDWANPEAESRVLDVVTQYPHVVKSPLFKDVMMNFRIAQQGQLRKELLHEQIGGRETLEMQRQQNRMEALTTRLDRMAGMKTDDQAFKVDLEELLQEHRLERDRTKASTSGTERFDLNKSDEIKMRSELNSLQIALNQGVLELPEFEQKREKVFKKYEALARKPAQPSAAPKAAGPAKRVRVKAPDGTIGHIPEDQLDEAKRNGYTIAE